MTSASPPAELALLLNPSVTFSATAHALSKSTSPANHFHTLISLHDFLTSASDAPLPARMKAEWCLWEAYSKWDLGLNPFLGHFVQVWESGGQTPDVLIVGVILSGQAHEVASWEGRG
jgi:hypothetical protein